ncbi:MAG: hypothetical protein KKB81_07720 [Candidatus Margulisbacteria bacterium]|nr:hypothetical protein [Candidatus Margulisiibacteriota bacterium]MBU1021236.1 hypothetical protein [Candidatus Margulisiibacteriota bacterium]MBU1729842.1 hypothetical protein [Candidatus Margulisiibacteriota bacterium]MBU1955343.1 hypothetical protein [Candidatus Margulisiibacteriota bacterium]
MGEGTRIGGGLGYESMSELTVSEFLRTTQQADVHQLRAAQNLSDQITIHLNRQGEQLRDADFAGAADALSRDNTTLETLFDNTNTWIGATASNIPNTPHKQTVLWNAIITAINYYRTRGAYYQQASDGRAVTYLGRAQAIYEVLLPSGDGINSHGPNSVGYPPLGRFLGPRYQVRNHFVHNDALKIVQSSIPEEFLGYAGVLQASINVNDIVKYEELLAEIEGATTEEQIIDEAKKIEDKINGKFGAVDAAINRAESEYENGYIPQYFGRGTSRADLRTRAKVGQGASVYIDITTELRAVFRIERKLAATRTRIQIAKADYLLRLAKRLRVNKHPLAEKLVEKAIALCEDALRNNVDEDYPEITTAAFMTLAWAYSSKANLMEDNAKGSGVDHALRAVAVRKMMLYGTEHESFTSDTDMLAVIEQPLRDGGPSLIDLINTHKNDFQFIRDSLASIRAGSGPIPGSFCLSRVNQFRSIDVLALLATNELELNLSLANDLRAARRYEEARDEYQLVLDRKEHVKAFHRYYKDNLIRRAKVGKATTLTLIANDAYWADREVENATTLLAEAEELCYDALQESQHILAGRIEHGKMEVSARELSMSSNEEDNSSMLSAADTLSWIYSLQGAMELQETGVRGEKLERANQILSAINYSDVDEDPALAAAAPEGASEFDQVVHNIYHITRSWRLGDGRMQALVIAETYFTKHTLALKRGTSLRSLQRYDDAIINFDRIPTVSALYSEARVSSVETQIERDRQAFLTAGFSTLPGARQVLLGTLQAARIDLAQISQETDDRVLQLRIALDIAGTHGMAGDVYRRNIQPAEAVAAFSQGAEALDALLQNTQLLDPANLKEANMYREEIRLSLAEMYRAAGDRDRVLLQNATSSYVLAATSPHSAEHANTIKAQRLHAIGELGIVEAGLLSAKCLERDGHYQDALNEISQLVPRTEAALQILLNQAATSPQAGREIYRALSTLAWAYGARGGLEERISGDGAGRQSFGKAASIYAAMIGESLTGVPGLTSEMQQILASSDLHHELGETPAKLYLNYADLLRASAKLGEGTFDFARLTQAHDMYNEAETQAVAETKFVRSQKLIFDTLLISWAEIKMMQASYRAEHATNPNTMRKIYYHALREYQTALLDVSQNFRGMSIPEAGLTLDQAKLYLRSARTISWALSGIAGLMENDYANGFAEAVSEGGTPLAVTDYQRLSAEDFADASAAINLALLGEEADAELAEAANRIINGGDAGALNQILSAREQITNQYVLEEIGLTIPEIHLSVVEALIAGHRFVLAEDRLALTKKAIKEDKSDGRYGILKASELIAQVHFKRGNLYCWHAFPGLLKQPRIQKARKSYEAGRAAVRRQNSSPSSIYDQNAALKIRDLEAQAAIAHCFYEERRYRKAIETYQQLRAELMQKLGIEGVPANEWSFTPAQVTMAERLARTFDAEITILTWAKGGAGYKFPVKRVERDIDTALTTRAFVLNGIPAEHKRTAAAMMEVLGDVMSMDFRTFRKREFSRGDHNTDLAAYNELADRLNPFINLQVPKVMSRIYGAQAYILMEKRNWNEAEVLYARQARDAWGSLIPWYDPDRNSIIKGFEKGRMNVLREKLRSNPSVAVTVGHIEGRYEGNPQIGTEVEVSGRAPVVGKKGAMLVIEGGGGFSVIDEQVPGLNLDFGNSGQGWLSTSYYLRPAYTAGTKLEPHFSAGFRGLSQSFGISTDGEAENKPYRWGYGLLDLSLGSVFTGPPINAANEEVPLSVSTNLNYSRVFGSVVTSEHAAGEAERNDLDALEGQFFVSGAIIPGSPFGPVRPYLSTNFGVGGGWNNYYVAGYGRYLTRDDVFPGMLNIYAGGTLLFDFFDSKFDLAVSGNFSANALPHPNSDRNLSMRGGVEAYIKAKKAKSIFSIGVEGGFGRNIVGHSWDIGFTLRWLLDRSEVETAK